MGMAASQARYLALAARMNDVEYQGQQINQQRTTLSNQANALYNSLLTLDIPTPPSTTDYTTVEYSGADGATQFVLGSIIPTGSTYSVDLEYTKTGHYMEEQGTVSAKAITATVKLSTSSVTQRNTVINGYEATSTSVATCTSTTNLSGHTVMKQIASPHTNNTGAVETVYVLRNGNFEARTVGTNDTIEESDLYLMFTSPTTPSTVTSGGTPDIDTNDKYIDLGTSNLTTRTCGGYKKSELNGKYVIDSSTGTAYQIIYNSSDGSGNLDDYFTVNQDGTYILRSGYTLAEATTTGSEYANGDYTDANIIGEIAGTNCYSLRGARSIGLVTTETMEGYIDSIRNAFSDYANADDDTILDSFGVYVTYNSETRGTECHFVEIQAVTSGLSNGNGVNYVPTYDYISNGSYTAVENKKQCQLTFDASGRISEIKIPTDYDIDGAPTTYKSIKLEAATVTDNAAYEDAYAKYEYSKYEYDKAQQDINAKTSVIQAQDKNLELKLTRLDNERNALKTEMDAVKEVIKNAIETSYKTFSG